ncbi:DUF6125 family protein [Rhodopila globiformis]|uniref:DUF6125 family protein n=1 Tax=Rhodopila globiformis TaxID=1071 RepID=UPI0038D09087
MLIRGSRRPPRQAAHMAGGLPAQRRFATRRRPMLRLRPASKYLCGSNVASQDARGGASIRPRRSASATPRRRRRCASAGPGQATAPLAGRSPRRRKGLAGYACRSGGVAGYSGVAGALDARMTCECGACLPDAHSVDRVCGRRFRIDGSVRPHCQARHRRLNGR